jgi:hypothetical protein
LMEVLVLALRAIFDYMEWHIFMAWVFFFLNKGRVRRTQAAYIPAVGLQITRRSTKEKITQPGPALLQKGPLKENIKSNRILEALLHRSITTSSTPRAATPSPGTNHLGWQHQWISSWSSRASEMAWGQEVEMPLERGLGEPPIGHEEQRQDGPRRRTSSAGELQIEAAKDPGLLKEMSTTPCFSASDSKLA